MKRMLILSALVLTLAACGGGLPRAGQGAEPVAAETGPRPKPRPTGLARPPQDARTIDEFDTSSAAERDAAAGAVASAAEQALGRSITSLGSPARPGFWCETPLVSAPAKGRVVAPQTGESVLVELIPIDAPQGAGSRLSLAAMRLLGVPLTGLVELEIYLRP